MNQIDKDFMEANLGNYHTIQSGFIRNIDIEILVQYEAIYRKYLNQSHYMCKYCKDDVFNTLKRLYEFYLALPQEVVQNIPKRGKK